MTEPVFRGIGVPADIATAVIRMKERAANRDISNDRVRKIRRGEFNEVWPEMFSAMIPTSIVANFVDQAARDYAANLAPLPSLACSAGQMRTDADRRRAEKKNRIGWNYWRISELQRQMYYAADQWTTYGFLPGWVEADYVTKMPKIRLLDPVGCYFELTRDLMVKRFARVWDQSIDELAAQFPEYEHQILFTEYGARYRDGDVEVVQWVDDTNVIIYIPARKNLVVASYAHRQPRCPVRVALRPGVELDPRGQFDDVLWVQLAHSIMAALTLEAGYKAVQAPLAVPSDVQELPLGPDAVIVSDSPEKIGRVGLNVPPAAFTLGEQLKEEMKEGAGYPDTRLGAPPPGGTTGRGVNALEGGFDTQIKLGQDILGAFLRGLTEDCFTMDAILWPREQKSINGTLSGKSFEITYVPGTDLKDTSCEVTYGFAAGVSPAGAIVTLLQLRGDQLISRDTVRRNLPMPIDIDQEKRSLLEQEATDGLMQGLQAALTASGQMMAQGQTDEVVRLYETAVGVIQAARAGDDITDIINQVFIQPVKQAQEAAQQQQQQMMQAMGAAQGGQGQPGGGGGGDSADVGLGANGLPPNTAPGQAGLPPGGRPSLMDISTGFTSSGQPSMGATVRRRIATG